MSMCFHPTEGGALSVDRDKHLHSNRRGQVEDLWLKINSNTRDNQLLFTLRGGVAEGQDSYVKDTRKRQGRH